MIIQHKTSK